MATGDQNDFVSRLLAQLPKNWFPSVAPVLNSILQGPALAFSIIYGSITFTKAQMRVSSAQGGFLDLAANDYFGDDLQRLQYEQDPAYRARILYNLTAPRGTWDGMVQMLEQLTGSAPTIFQPNMVQQTGGWATQSNPAIGGGTLAFYNNSGTGGSGFWGSLEMPCQVFITVAEPTSGFAIYGGYGGYATQASTAIGGGYGLATQSNPAAGGGMLIYIDPDSVPGEITNALIYEKIAEWMPVGYQAWVNIT